LLLFGGIFDYATKSERLIEVTRELAEPTIWNDPEKAQNLGRESAELKNIVSQIDKLTDGVAEAKEFLTIAKAENDATVVQAVEQDINQLATVVAKLEFQRMFAGTMDPNNAFLDIQAGSGGTEAQDWAEMLLRMYLRWAESHDFKVTLMEVSAGDVAGIKSATVKIEGAYAYGWLRTETGVHRLVRKSPFDANNKRHTSFAAVFIYPEIDDAIAVEINPADLKIDTYRASGAGGQHVNRTDSAVRITHLPTNTVVQCQSDRSQHKNKASALKQLKAKLYELEMQKRRQEQQSIEANKADIGWGRQIRSYVLDQARIKDLRTMVETTNTQAVLDGALDQFIEVSLKSGL
jgi:peptide chain release factor 2